MQSLDSASPRSIPGTEQYSNVFYWAGNFGCCPQSSCVSWNNVRLWRVLKLSQFTHSQFKWSSTTLCNCGWHLAATLWSKRTTIRQECTEQPSLGLCYIRSSQTRFNLVGSVLWPSDLHSSSAAPYLSPILAQMPATSLPSTS